LPGMGTTLTLPRPDAWSAAPLSPDPRGPPYTRQQSGRGCGLGAPPARVSVGDAGGAAHRPPLWLRGPRSTPTAPWRTHRDPSGSERQGGAHAAAPEDGNGRRPPRPRTSRHGAGAGVVSERGAALCDRGGGDVGPISLAAPPLQMTETRLPSGHHPRGGVFVSLAHSPAATRRPAAHGRRRRPSSAVGAERRPADHRPSTARLIPHRRCARTALSRPRWADGLWAAAEAAGPTDVRPVKRRTFCRD